MRSGQRLLSGDGRIWQSIIVCAYSNETTARWSILYGLIASAGIFPYRLVYFGAQTREPHLSGAAFPASGGAAFQTTPEEPGYNAYPSYECIRQ
jgi:hypothetical protein